MPAFNVYGAADLAEITQAYRDAEAHILRLIAKALEKGAKGTGNYYKAQYSELHEVRREAEKALNKALSKSNQEVAGLLAANAQGAAADAVPGVMAPAINTEAVNALTLETAASLASMKSGVLRSVNDTFRAITRTVSSRGIMTGETMKDRLQAALNEYAAKGLTAYTDASGRQWKIDSYAEMALRTATNRAQNQGREEQFKAFGIGLIRTSQHVGCSDLCLPYQGKILSLDGRTGTVKEVDPATGNNVTVTITATLDDAIANGYHHPNCRHTDTAYIPGTPDPEPVETDAEEEAAEQAQRYNERQIRAWKRREAVAITPQEKAKASAKVREWQAQQREHLKNNPWLSRRYDREQIRAGVAGRATGLPEEVKLNAAAAATKTHAQLLAEQAAPSTPINEYMRETMDGFDPSGLKLFKGTKHSNNSMTVGGVKSKTQGVNLEDFYTPGMLRTPGNINPNYGKARGYGINCDRVVQAAELQSRGYYVRAGHDSTRIDRGTSDSFVYTQQQKQEFQSVRLRAPLEEKMVGRTAPVSNSDLSLATGWRTKDGKVRQFYRSQLKTERSRNARTMKDMDASVPDGARGFVTCDWKGKNAGGHIWNWEKKDGEIVFYEFQNKRGRIDSSTYLAKAKPGTLEMVRMDDMVPTDEVLYILGDPTV